MNSLYVMTPEYYLSLDDGNVVIQYKGEERSRFPLLALENIICFTYAGASPALMGECVQHGINLSFFTPNGRFMARASGGEHGNVLLRQQQYRIADDAVQSCLYARNMMLGKAFNYRWIVERAIRDHSLRLDAEKLGIISQEIVEIMGIMRKCAILDELRGLEGEVSLKYFSVFDEMILQQKDDFCFTRRTRRPPLDNVNALLSFAYVILAGDCASALESVGLDPYVGFMHQPRSGRTSLALDLMEELRGPWADRFVLTCINQKVIQKKHFDRQESGAVLLNDQGRRTFFAAWQEKKKELITHPFLKEKIEWGLVPYVQALLLARTIRGDIDEYPPFMWK